MIDEPPLGVLIVDDEPIARRRLQRLLRRIEGVTVLGEAGDVAEALAAVQQLAPEVVLMDIQIPGGGGFAALERMAPPRPAVIFVTAHDRYALRAFDVEAVDYVTKPVELSRLALALARARSASAAQEHRERIDELQSTVQSLRGALARAAGPVHAIWIRSGTEMRSIDIDTISHIRAERDYVRIHAGGRSWLHGDTLSGMEEKLAPHGVLRVHRSVLVLRRAVVGIGRRGRGRLELRLADGSAVPVGRSHVAAVGAALGLQGPEPPADPGAD